MSITMIADRQAPSEAYVDINLADIATGVAQAAIQMPINAVVTGGSLVTITAFNSTSTDTLSIGDASSAARYLSGSSIHSTALAALVPTGFVTTSTEPNIVVTWTSGGGTPTTGKIRVRVSYIILGRADFTQG